MPKEATIRKKAITELESKGWICWYPKKVKFHETDIMGVFDLLCLHPDYQFTRYIQLTTFSNLSARRKKVGNFLKKHNLRIWAEIWAWHKGKKDFVIERFD